MAQQKKNLRYVVGDATNPQANREDKIIIMHCCNNKRKWGAGFVLSLSKKWPEVRRIYMKSSMNLGSISWVNVSPNIWIANIIGQNGYGRGGCYVDYEALQTAFGHIASFAKEKGCQIHCPKLGSGLAGGDWVIIENLIQEKIVSKQIPVTVYNFF